MNDIKMLLLSFRHT